jgi:DNA repair protein RadD
MKLRDYQQAMVDRIVAAWDRGDQRVLGVLPTGGGKTECALSLIVDSATPTSRALVVVDRKVLAHQWAARLRRHAPDAAVGILQAEATARTWAPILVATAQTVRARGVPEGVGLVVIDETHIWHRLHDHLLEATAGARVLGLTATPLRDGLGLRFDAMVVGATIRQLIAAGHLVRPRYFAPTPEAVTRALATVAVRAGDYAADQLSRAMRSKTILGDVVGEWQRRGQGRQTIAFCVDKTHAHDLAAEFVGVGVAAEVVVDDTADDDRARIFAAFERGDTRVLCSVGVLAVGFDSPVAGCAILARPTLSTGLYIQQGGRVLRPHPSKHDALILDHAGNVLRHGRLEDFEPPADLSQLDRAADRKARQAAPTGWICRHCHAVNDLGTAECVECGEPRRRQTAVVQLDADLVELGAAAATTAARGPTVDEICTFYRMALWHAQAHRISPGAAYFKTCSRFKLDPRGAGRTAVPLSWRSLEPLPPDAEAARWFRADFQRYLIARRHRAAA